jgi:hypothetical protein
MKETSRPCETMVFGQMAIGDEFLLWPFIATHAVFKLADFSIGPPYKIVLIMRSALHPHNCHTSAYNARNEKIDLCQHVSRSVYVLPILTFGSTSRSAVCRWLLDWQHWQLCGQASPSQQPLFDQRQNCFKVSLIYSYIVCSWKAHTILVWFKHIHTWFLKPGYGLCTWLVSNTVGHSHWQWWISKNASIQINTKLHKHASRLKQPPSTLGSWRLFQHYLSLINWQSLALGLSTKPSPLWHSILVS